MISSDFRYDLYYIPEFPLDELEYKRDNGDKQLQEFIDDVTEHIRVFGLENPPTVHLKDGRYDVRPGKCRVTALKRLGRRGTPVVLADYDRAGPLPGWEPLPYDARYIQNKFYTRDCVPEVSRRYFSVKKNVDVVHRPGVENPFAKEIRERNDSKGCNQT